MLTCYEVFCLFLLVWVYFWVPETKGVRIEEMDKIFGGNQGEQDVKRLADIRQRLGITLFESENTEKGEVMEIERS